jgi:hypothetical protein
MKLHSLWFVLSTLSEVQTTDFHYTKEREDEEEKRNNAWLATHTHIAVCVSLSIDECVSLWFFPFVRSFFSFLFSSCSLSIGGSIISKKRCERVNRRALTEAVVLLLLCAFFHHLSQKIEMCVTRRRRRRRSCKRHRR